MDERNAIIFEISNQFMENPHTMATKQEIQAKIDSLEFAKTLLEKELVPLREQLAAIEKKIQTLIDGEIAPLKDELAAAEQKIEREWADNPYANDRQTKHSAEFFRSCGYVITECQTYSPSDVTYALAKQLWSCYEIALPLLKQLYKANYMFSYPTDKHTSEERNSLMNLCQTMARHQWLTFVPAKTSLDITPTIPKQHRQFLNGGWAEAVNRYLIYKTLASYSKEHDLKYKVLWNVCLKKIGSERQNSHDMELDIVVDLKDRFYVFETKSGEVLCLAKWIDRARIFNRDKSRFITCCMDDKVNPKLFAPYRLFALQKLESQLTEMLSKDFCAVSE